MDVQMLLFSMDTEANCISVCFMQPEQWFFTDMPSESEQPGPLNETKTKIHILSACNGDLSDWR